jgi:hypothetical protein
MSKKLKVAGAVALDPTLPKVSLELAGETWQLCFDYAALAIAEQKLADAGEVVNMLLVMDIRYLGASRLPIVFFASLVRCHPEVTLAKVRSLVTMESFSAVYDAVVQAYLESCPSLKEKKKAVDPIEEPAAK